MVGQLLARVRSEPALISKFKSVAVPLRQGLQECFQPLAVDAPARGELEQDRASVARARECAAGTTNLETNTVKKRIQYRDEAQTQRCGKD